MNQQIQSDTIKKIAVPVLIAALALGIGYYVGRQVGQQEQEQILKEVFSNANFANNLSGKITAISPDKKSLAVEVRNILGVNFPKEYQGKTVLITQDTKIILREQKSQEVMNEEIKKYQVNTANAKGTKNPVPLAPPAPYLEKEMSVDTLKVGDSVSFSFNPATGGSATFLNNQFIALEVVVTR